MPVYLVDENDLSFPNPEFATEEGLIAMGGDLSEARLISAYETGVFPWYSEGEPILWWSPDPRCVLYPGDIHIQKSMRKKVREELPFVTADKALDRVIDQCGRRVDWLAGCTGYPSVRLSSESRCSPWRPMHQSSR